MAAALIAAYLAWWLLRRAARRSPGTLAERLGDELALPVAAVAFVVLGWLALAVTGETHTGAPVAFVLVVAALALVVDRLVGEATNWHLRHLAHGTGTVELHSTLAPLARQLLRGILFFIALITVLGRFKVPISGILTTAGVASLAFALAAQDTLANLFAGVTILFDRPFRVGDRVEVGAVVGDVVQIGMRSTRIRTFAHNIVVIPNKDIVAAELTNRNYPDLQMTLHIDVGVGYDTDMQLAKRLMLEVARACPDVLADPAPAVYFTGFGDSSLNVQMWVYVGDYRRVFPTTDALNEGVLEAFRAAGIEIPFPQRVVTMKGPVASAPGGGGAE